MNNKSYLIALFWSVVLAILVMPSAHAQVASLPPTSLVGPYEGDSLKVFAVGNVYDQNTWQQIENYTSADFDIAGTFQKGNFTYVILERVGIS